VVLVNTDFISGKTIETISLVSGARRLDFTGVNDGGVYHAVADMVERAKSFNADGIINIKYSLSEHYAFVAGTAVRFI